MWRITSQNKVAMSWSNVKDVHIIVARSTSAKFFTLLFVSSPFRLREIKPHDVLSFLFCRGVKSIDLI